MGPVEAAESSPDRWVIRLISVKETDCMLVQLASVKIDSKSLVFPRFHHQCILPV